MDGLRSVVSLTDESATVRAEYRYGPFGQTEPVGNDRGNSFQFTGRENDETGLYYYRFRYYHPKLSRFIGEDPLRVLRGANLNRYVTAFTTSRTVSNG